jgi:hypothetical protein
MIAAPKPPDEERRLAALHALNLLDTESEERFDRITRLAQRVFGTRMATFTLVDADRQSFKSEVGAAGKEDARDISFCSHAILDPETTVIEDARLDKRFHDNPLVLGDPDIRFYAGHPVAGPGGEVLGTLCVIDDRPRSREEFDAEALRETAAILGSTLRASDLVARLGSDEFCALLVSAPRRRPRRPWSPGSKARRPRATPTPTVPGRSRSASAWPKVRAGTGTGSGTWSPAPTRRCSRPSAARRRARRACSPSRGGSPAKIGRANGVHGSSGPPV